MNLFLITPTILAYLLLPHPLEKVEPWKDMHEVSTVEKQDRLDYLLLPEHAPIPSPRPERLR